MQHDAREVRALFRAAVEGVQAPRLLERAPWLGWTRREAEAYRRIVIVGIGKAALAMGGEAERQLGEVNVEGLVVVPEGHPETLPPALTLPERLDVLEAGHPLPDARSAQAAERILARAKACTEEDLLLVLVSGGGTALTFGPADDLALADVQETVELLLEAGADIRAMNAVRKHLARVGGGRLAQAAAPAEVLALVISDVAGDELSVIASGPTVPDPSTYGEALEVLRRHKLTEHIPLPVRTYLERNQHDAEAETPKPSDPGFEHVRTELIGRNRDALEAAARAAEQRGYDVRFADQLVTGEARKAGRRLAREALRASAEVPRCLLWGGETTVTVEGDGRGGRNQELALAAALELDGHERDIVLLSGGTDGIDGPTDAAGAVVSPHTVTNARRQGLDAHRYLENNNSYTFFKQVDGLVRTGPTHTNVMDVQIALVEPA